MVFTFLASASLAVFSLWLLFFVLVVFLASCWTDGVAIIRLEPITSTIESFARVWAWCCLLVWCIVGIGDGAANGTRGVAFEEHARGNVSVVGYCSLSVLGVGARCCSDSFDALGDLVGGEIGVDVSDVEALLHGLWGL